MKIESRARFAKAMLAGLSKKSENLARTANLSWAVTFVDRQDGVRLFRRRSSCRYRVVLTNRARSAGTRRRGGGDNLCWGRSLDAGMLHDARRQAYGKSASTALPDGQPPRSLALLTRPLPRLTRLPVESVEFPWDWKLLLNRSACGDRFRCGPRYLVG